MPLCKFSLAKKRHKQQINSLKCWPYIRISFISACKLVFVVNKKWPTIELPKKNLLEVYSVRCPEACPTLHATDAGLDLAAYGLLFDSAKNA